MNAQIDVTNIYIETSRLVLRPWRETDLADLYEYASVPGVGEMAGWCHHKSIDETQKIIQMFMDEKEVLAIELKDCGKVIGSLGIHNNDHDHVGAEFLGREVGYVLSKDYWGKGLVPEAVQGVIKYCFDVLQYDYLLCGHFSWNNQSRRVIEKCGFSYLKDIVHTTKTGTEELTKLYVIRNPNK